MIMYIFFRMGLEKLGGDCNLSGELAGKKMIFMKDRI